MKLKKKIKKGFNRRKKKVKFLKEQKRTNCLTNYKNSKGARKPALLVISIN
jgi:hypothetical protein